MNQATSHIPWTSEEIARFMTKVSQPAHGHACWFWTASKNKKGYGRLFLRGKCVQAHRVSWEFHNGSQFPAGLFALHSCDNPSCVNPEHIRPGTNTENIREAAAKGRLTRITQRPWFKRFENTVNAKTHCMRGHPLSGDNLYYFTKLGVPSRSCRECSRIRDRVAWKRRTVVEGEE